MQIEHHIALCVLEEIELAEMRGWFRVVRDNAPSGVVTTVSVSGQNVQIAKQQCDGGISYTIPLMRDLTEVEVERIITAFNQTYSGDYTIRASASPLEQIVNTDVVVDHDPMMELCTGWAKKKHEEWMASKSNDGWRFGMAVSTTDRTHPLMRPWSDLPEEARKVDITQAQELMSLLRDSGYILIRREDLEKLL